MRCNTLVAKGVISLPPLAEVKIQRERRDEKVGVYNLGKRDRQVLTALSDRTSASQRIAEELDSSVKCDATGSVVVIHSSHTREELRLALQNANRDVAPPPFIQEWFSSRDDS